MHIPWYFYLFMVLDPIVIIVTGFILMRKIKKVVGSLEGIAREAVGSAAEDVGKEIQKMLPKRPELGDEGKKLLGALGSLAGFSPQELSPLHNRVKK